MRKVYINNIEIEFDGKITFKDFNPFFGDYSGYSMPFTIPLTLKNKEAINYAHIVETNKADIKYFDAKIVTPIRTYIGKFKFIRFSGKNIELYYYDNYGFWDIVKNYTLNDITINFLPAKFTTTQWYNFLNEWAYNEFVFAPVYNENISDNFPLDLETFPLINEATPAVYYGDVHYTMQWVPYANNIIQAFPKLYILVEKIFEHFGYKILVNEIKTTKNYNLFCVYYNFLPFKWEFRTLSAQDEVSDVDIDTDEYVIIQGFMPEVQAGDLIKFYSVRGSVELNSKVAQVTEIIDSTHFKINILSSEVSPFIYYDPAYYVKVLPVFIETNSVATHKVFPDWTINKFLKELNKWGIQFFVNDNLKTVEIKIIKRMINNTEFVDITNNSGKIKELTHPEYDSFVLKYKVDSSDLLSQGYHTELSDDFILKENVATLLNLPINGEYNEVRYVISEKAYYKYVPHINAANSKWEFLTKGIFYKTEGETPYTHEIEMSPLINSQGTVIKAYRGQPYAYSAKCVAINQPINAVFLNENSSTPLRIFMYLGLTTYNDYLNTYTFPLSSSDYKKFNGEAYDLDICDIDLTDFQGEYGVYEKLLKEFIHWTVNVRKDVKTKIIWLPGIFQNMKWYKKYRVKNTNYFVKSISRTEDFENDITIWGDTELAKV